MVSVTITLVTGSSPLLNAVMTYGTESPTTATATSAAFVTVTFGDEIGMDTGRAAPLPVNVRPSGNWNV
ncbi:hypothetical protein D3C79_1076530 [compost metagenome]